MGTEQPNVPTRAIYWRIGIMLARLFGAVFGVVFSTAFIAVIAHVQVGNARLADIVNNFAQQIDRGGHIFGSGRRRDGPCLAYLTITFALVVPRLLRAQHGHGIQR